ncbi:MAG: 4-alpha-glucanotransferase [Acetobacter sp.]|nr:4-alpha-glucanotransferase [Acetobacter sp.]
MSELLKKLADKLNICTSFTYGCGTIKTSVVSDDQLRFFIENFGYDAKNDEEIQRSLDRLEKKRWQQALEAIYVVVQDDKSFDIVLTADEAKGDISVSYAKEGEKKNSALNVSFVEEESRKEGRQSYVRLRGVVEADLEPDYYDIKVKTNKGEYKTVLAVAPKQCYALDKKGKEKLFGFAVQLYSLKSRRNWGVGDFTDLENIVDIMADSGGDIIGLNPLNVLQHDFPETASPYASVSRLFLNPIYIDVEKVPFYDEEDKDGQAIWFAKEKENIDYTSVYNAKIKAMRNIYARMKANEDSEYTKEFEAFKAADTGELHRLAVFQTIGEERAKMNGKASKQWNEALSSALSSGVEKFAAEHLYEVDFFKFLQFEADRQLRLVEKKIKERQLVIGLYRDLPVGVSKDSAEVWGDKYLYVQGSGAGAPPDNYFPTGQKWMLGAFNPFELKERCYKPFIRILRANMRYAGAVRIDHVMGLSRLYIIPDKGEEGTYIRYNEKDMMNILALESYLNKCVVVGECIGNVAGGFKEMLAERNIYSLGVLWVERKDENGTLKSPNEYETKYFASVGTHDMPPLKAWWYGSEIGIMKDLGLFSEEEARNGYSWREHERRLLLSALDNERVWPEDRYRHSDYLYGDGYPEGIEEAVHSYMAKTNSEVFMLQPEDIFQSMKVQNLPGTDVDKYPNWRSKLPVDIEDISSSEAYHRNIKAVRRWR